MKIESTADRRLSRRFNDQGQREFGGALVRLDRTDSFCMTHYDVAEQFLSYAPPWETRACDSGLARAICDDRLPARRQRALEIGCGYGYSAMHLATVGFQRVVGVDLSLPAIRRARRYARNRGLARTTKFICYDVYELPAAPDGFDLVYDNTIFNNTAVHTPRSIDDYTRMLKRVIAADGVFILVFARDPDSTDGLSTRFPQLPVPSIEHIENAFRADFVVEAIVCDDGIEYDLVDAFDPARVRIPHPGGYAVMRPRPLNRRRHRRSARA